VQSYACSSPLRSLDAGSAAQQGERDVDRSRLRTTAVPSGRWLAVAAALLLLSGPALALEPQDPEWEQLLHAYLVDPEGNREAVLALGKSGTEGLGAPAILLIADAQFRAGEYGEARRLFRQVVEQEEVEDRPTAASSIGHFGLAMVEVEGGDFAGAYEEFGRAGGPESQVAVWAKLGTAQSAAAIGKTDEALEALQELSATEDLAPPLREAALFSEASVHLRNGDTEKAAALLDQVIGGSNPRLATEAAYAKAQLERKNGDPRAARKELEGLLAKCPDENAGEAEPSADADADADADAKKDRERRRMERRLGELDPSAIMQAWVQNYREMPLVSWRGRETPPFGFGGCSLARTALASLEELPVETPVVAGAGAPPAASAGAGATTGAVAATSLPNEVASAGTSEATTPEQTAEGSSLVWLGILAAIVGVAGVLYFVLRRG